MVRTNFQEFIGDVHVLSNLQVGSNLFANDLAANVLTVDGSIGSTFFIGDGGLLSNIATTLNDIVANPGGNTVSNTLVFESGADATSNTAITTLSNVGISISNTEPTGEFQFAVGSNIFVNTHASNVLTVIGAIGSNLFIGDGGLLSNIATTLDQIVDQGNTVSNTIQLVSGADATSNAGLVTHKDVAISVSNVNPTGEFQFGVGANLFVNTYSSNVLTVEGNVVANTMTLGSLSVTSAYGLNHVTAQGSVTSDTISLTNATTGLSASSNITAGGNVTAQTVITTANVEVGNRLKFASNVFVDDLRVADLAANLVTYDKTTGELMDSGGLFANKLAVVSVQPPSALSANATTVANHGTYTLTTSGLLAASNTWNAFDGDSAVEWTSPETYSAGGGTYAGTSNLFAGSYVQSGVASSGEWLAIEFPYKTTLRHMKLTPPATVISYPASANLYATNDSLTWTELANWSDVNPVTSSNVQTVIVNASASYKKYALSVTKSNGSTSNVALGEWKLFAESFSIDGGKVAMAQQAATGGETVMDQSGPHGRLPKTVPLKKYPEIVFENGKFDYNDSTNTYVQAGYTVTASDQNNGSSRYVWQLFDNLDGSVWGTSGGSFLSGQPGIASSTGDEITLADNTTHTRGHWAKIKFPNKIIISTYTLNSTSADRRPQSISILGSNNDTDWYIIKDVHTVGSQDEYSISVNATTAYKYIMFMVHSIVGSDNQMTIGDLKFYGYEEDPPAGDTSVDTTFTSIMNTPQTTGANVYVDGSLGETFTNRVTGPTVSNTHTTYVSAGKYWELSGNVESNVTIEANTFLSGDAPHSFSVWFNSSNLEANASNSCIFSIGTEERFDHIGAAFSNNYQTVDVIAPSVITSGIELGYAIDVTPDGTRMVVGAPFDDTGGTNYGSAYIYTYSDGRWDTGVRLLPGNPTSGTGDQGFGHGVAINSAGTRVAIGAHYDDTNGYDQGAVYIYEYSGGSWSRTQKMYAPTAHRVDERYGYDLSMSNDGTRLVVGTRDGGGVGSKGKVYVYTYSNGAFQDSDSAVKVIQASDVATGGDAQFGYSVSMSGDGTKFVAGAPSHDTGGSNIGAAYVFTYDSATDTWSEQEKIQASDKQADDKFGYCVSMSNDGTTIVAGAPYEDTGGSDAGAVYIYKYANGSWYNSGNNENKLQAPGSNAYSSYGWSAALNTDGTKLAVGARNHDAGGINTGAAYIHNYDGSSWSQKKTLIASVRTDYDHFGLSVAITDDGEKVIVGSRGTDISNTSDTGAVYVYTRDTTHYLTTNLNLQSNTWHNLTYAYQGEGGSRVTYLDGRKVAEDQAEDTFGEYPPFAMTGYSQGGYVVSASSEYSNFLAWEAFDDITGSSTVSGYWSGANANYPSANGIFNGGTSAQFTTNVEGVSKYGDWLQIEFPHKVKYSYSTILAPYDHEERLPRDGYIVGSNDGISWTTLHRFEDMTRSTVTETVTYTPPSAPTQAFKYFRIVIEAISSGGGNYAGIDQWDIYGHRENDLVRLPDPTNVLKYPHIPLTNYPDRGGPGRRGYVATSSGAPNAAYDAQHAFNGVTVSGEGSWHSASYYQTTGDRLATRTPTSSLSSWTANGGSTTGELTTHTGEWVKIQLPHKIVLNSIILKQRTGIPLQKVRLFSIVGSNDDTNWFLVHQELTRSGTSTSLQEPDPNTMTGSYSNTAFKYFAIVIHAGVTDNTYDHVAIGEWELYGTGVDSIPIQIGGGNIDKVANFRVYDKFIEEDQALEIWDAQKDEFGRAKSSMTLHKGRLGIGTTEPEGRLAVADEPDSGLEGLQEFPPRGLSDSLHTYIEGHGIFKVYASQSRTGTNGAVNLFDKKSVGSAGSFWLVGNGAGYNTSTGAYEGESGTIYRLADETSTGHYVTLEMPYPIKLEQYSVGPRSPSDYQSPEDWELWGSNDGSSWTKLHNVIGNTEYKISVLYNAPQTNYYRHFGFVVTRTIMTGAPAGYDYLSVGELKFFGYREQVMKQSVLHDGQLTLTKNLNVPRIGPALDADDTPRRDRLVVEYNTSTNPTFEGVVRDTSGRGNDGVLYSSVSYDATAKSFESFGGGGLETMAMNNLLPTNGTHTFSAWIRFDTSGTWYAVYGIGGNVTFSGNNTITVYIGSGVFRLESRGGSYRDYGYTFKHGKWVHMAVVYGGTGGYDNFDIYMDTVKLGLGSASSNGTTAITLPTANQTVRFGSSAESSPGAVSSSYLSGGMSSIKFYNTALTLEEIKTLYDMGRCDEGHHVVNFSKTRVGIGLGDGDAPHDELDVRGNVRGSDNVIIGPYGGPHWWRLYTYQTNGNLAFIGEDDTEHGYLIDSSTVNNIDFTGQHRSIVDKINVSDYENLEGLIVSANKNKYVNVDKDITTGSNAIQISQSLPVVSLSNVVHDKACYGVIAGSEDPESRTYEQGTFVSVFQKQKGDTRAFINSVGEGAIWVVNTNGSLESGDYITTSNVAGYGQKQDDDVLHNYTVAKITMDCDFNPATQPVQQILRSNVVETYYLGNVHKVKSVPHEFVTTVVGADDEWSNVSVSPSDVTYAEWSNLEVNTQNTYTLTYTQTSNVVYDTKYTLTTTANVTESAPWDNVFIDPPTVTYAEWSNLEANTQNTYTLTFTQTTTDTKTPEEWSALESNTQSLYNKVYYQSVEEEVAATWPGAVAHTRVTDRIENELDEHGQIQWEDHPTETEKAYKIRYLDANGVETDSANVVHIAAFVGCTYHCG